MDKKTATQKVKKNYGTPELIVVKVKTARVLCQSQEEEGEGNRSGYGYSRSI